MQEYIFLTYYVFILAGIGIGIKRFRELDHTLHYVVFLLVCIALCEMAAFVLYKAKQYHLRPIIYHFSSIAEIVLVSIYFLKLTKPAAYNRLFISCVVGWPLIGIVNILFFEHITELNTNMLMLESFSIICMSLYAVYDLLKKEIAGNLFHNPHFWIAILWLILWSGTFFFWAFIKVLSRSQWQYLDIIQHLQIVLCVIVYAGIASVLFLYPKKYQPD